MTLLFFADPDHRPTEEEILAAVGRAAGAWRALFDQVRTGHPELVEDWRYYRDGNSWLLKVSRKTTTVFWLSVEKGAFRVTFYFPERLVGRLLESGISEERKAEIRGGKAIGKLHPVSVRFGPRRGVRDVMTLIAVKKRLK